MTYDQGAGVTLVQVVDQSPQGSLLFWRARVGGLTADVEPALVADANRLLPEVVATPAAICDKSATRWYGRVAKSPVTLQ